MTQDEIIELAVKAGIAKAVAEVNIDILETFVKLVLANNPPESSMSYQEGFEAGNRLAIDGFCRQLSQLHDSYSLASDAKGLRARGNHG